MGRAPCCDKANVKKGPWSPEEDAKLKSYIEQHGTGGNWIALPQKMGLKRCGKSCRLRWLNYLRPNLKHGGFSEEEDNIICSLYISIGSRWSVIAAQLPGRTDNDIKNYWNTRLKKKLLGKHRKEQQQARHKRGNNNNGGVKQESNSTSSTGECSFFQHSNPYLPHMMLQPSVLSPPPTPPPHLLPYTNPQGQCFNDQDSIRKLLIKLGGRFSGDDHDGLNNNLQFSSNNICDIGTTTPSTEQVHVGSSDHANNNINQVQFAQSDGGQYNCGEVLDHDMVQGQGNFISSSTNYPQRFDGLEFFYGDHEDILIDNKIIFDSSSTTPVYHYPLY